MKANLGIEVKYIVSSSVIKSKCLHRLKVNVHPYIVIVVFVHESFLVLLYDLLI